MKILVTFLCCATILLSPVKNFGPRLSDAAISILDANVKYDGTYTEMQYPMGDVDKTRGVCTDVVIRSYRKLGIDLQKEVHEDMKSHFSSYPAKWGLKKPDTNIDHRRVPNLEIFFGRNGKKLTVTNKASDYGTGDIVTWMIDGKLPHIGIVTNRMSADGKRPLIVHNVGGGQVLEDCLFRYGITGHFTYGK